jgi:fructokinase
MFFHPPAIFIDQASRMGANTEIIGGIGNDGFGEYIIKKLTEVSVSVEGIKKINRQPTSVIFVSKSQGTPDFIPFRAADFWITEDQIPIEILQKSKIFHTTCFALSKNPAQTTILTKAKEAFDLGCKLSIDINYSEKLWESQAEALSIIELYCKYNPLIKISEDDMIRLFEKRLPHETIFKYFHDLNVETVCLTLGQNGVKLSQKNKPIISLPAIKVEKVVDTTGAGDAFWSGFLFAYINQKPIEECLQVALKLAALKLQNVGRLPDNINILSKLL